MTAVECGMTYYVIAALWAAFHCSEPQRAKRLERWNTTGMNWWDILETLAFLTLLGMSMYLISFGA